MVQYNEHNTNFKFVIFSFGYIVFSSVIILFDTEILVYPNYIWGNWIQIVFKEF